MARPELYPVKKIIGFDQKMIDAIEKWRSRQKPVSNVSEAIRQLVAAGLKTASPRKAIHLAGKEIDRMTDRSATSGEQKKRKDRLLKGPDEFRAIRGDHPKRKR